MRSTVTGLIASLAGLFAPAAGRWGGEARLKGFVATVASGSSVMVLVLRSRSAAEAGVSRDAVHPMSTVCVCLSAGMWRSGAERRD